MLVPTAPPFSSETACTVRYTACEAHRSVTSLYFWDSNLFIFYDDLMYCQ